MYILTTCLSFIIWTCNTEFLSGSAEIRSFNARRISAWRDLVIALVVVNGTECRYCHLLDDSSPHTCCLKCTHPFKCSFCCLYLEVFYSFGLNCMGSCLSILILTMSQWACPEWLSLVLLVCCDYRFSYSQVVWLQRFPGCSDKAATAFLLGCGIWSSFCAHTFTWKRWRSRRG